MLNSPVVVFIAGVRAYGTEPGASARRGVEDTPKLTVQVLGNPVHASAVEIAVSGAEGQSLTFQLTDLSGRLVTSRQVERAGAAELQRLEVGGASAGMLLLQVSTPTQRQTVKVLRQ